MPIGLWDVEAFSRQSAHRWRWGCQPYAPAALYTPGRFLVLISVRSWVNLRAIVRLGGFFSIKKSNDLNGNRTRGLPACSIVPQPTTLPRAPVSRRMLWLPGSRVMPQFSDVSWYRTAPKDCCPSRRMLWYSAYGEVSYYYNGVSFRYQWAFMDITSYRSSLTVLLQILPPPPTHELHSSKPDLFI
jgi:hypothetical protein